ncbi:conserved oligomeric Golgi complex subunit 2-like isoform X1 [Neovison vison]|uniref:conserved oligomeric Golgi complex subunit 2-like isoform X1 n=1 Tax=Neovison vison TaxID=452646 RepID=UPI001CEFE89A|nr:conserved oligomeric Golgi complex subunit 2-like isoform X1 [Neogale vison]
MERRRMNLPKGPDTFCFDRDEFMKEDFDVDHFVSDCRNRVQLEELREDLELYYKLLKTAMVELINKDYADFVNLSTNLVNLKFTSPTHTHTHTHTHTLSLSFIFIKRAEFLETFQLITPPTPPET